ncbi:MAG TPA: pyridoxal phosphate-dependent aminotransferase family protein [Candidatus Anammoximicrobium sp.]|nr:pyridoxal phosphate-dependent aminotransferase family protein [Candidatus Anammoximicrobium sp.]
MHSEMNVVTDQQIQTPSAAPRTAERRVAAAATDRSAVQRLTAHLSRDRIVRLALLFLDNMPDVHLKDLHVDMMDDDRRMRIAGRELTNFGSDSFLGLDRHPAVQEALVEATGRWGTHNGASRAFCSVSLCEEAEYRLARWLGVEDTLIFPTVTLANVGLIPAIVAKGDLLVVDRQSHDTIHQAAKIAAADGAELQEVHPLCAESLERILEKSSAKNRVVAVDGVYSMTGRIPPLKQIDDVTRRYGGVLYVDDAHGTAVVGPGGRGAAYLSLGGLDQVLMVGSLSKAFSCMGAFVTCNSRLKRVLKLRSSTFIFGGPVPPPYLAAVCAVCDILESPEYDRLLERLQGHVRRLTAGVRALGLTVLGGDAPIVSVVIGDIEQTLQAGKWLFDRGYYVQSATYPAVPLNAGLLRILVNANHSDEALEGLLAALAEMKDHFHLGRQTVSNRELQEMREGGLTK